MQMAVRCSEGVGVGEKVVQSDRCSEGVVIYLREQILKREASGRVCRVG